MEKRRAASSPGCSIGFTRCEHRDWHVMTGASLEFESLMRLQHLGRRMPLRARGPLTSLPGAFVHRRRGRGLEIHDIRAWQHGDDIRHLDRNVTARTGVQHVRTFRDERDRALLLVADFRPSMLFGTRRAFRSIAAAEAVTLLGWHAVAQGGRVGGMAAGAASVDAMPLGRGMRTMVQVLAMLTKAHAEALAAPAQADPPLTAVLEAATRMLPAGGSILIATSLDAPGDEFDAVVGWLARRNDVRFALVRDAFEREPPPGLYPFFTQSGRKGTLAVRAGAASMPEDRCARLRRHGASAIIVDADSSPEDLAGVLETLHV
jgi:uncharacterized protein (DUF58 family)